MLTPFSLQKTFQSGIAQFQNRRLAGDGCSELLNMEPQGGVLRPIQWNEEQVFIDETDWIITPVLVATVRSIPVYFGQETTDTHPKLFVIGSSFADVTSIATLPDAAVAIAGSSFSEDVIDVLFTDKSLMRVMVTIATDEVTFTAETIVSDYGTSLALFRNRPFIAGGGEGLFASFDTYFELFLGSLGVTSYELYGTTFGFSEFVPSEARKRTVLWSGLYGSTIRTIEDPEKFLVGSEVTLSGHTVAGTTTYDATLGAEAYILNYVGSGSFNVTITHKETSHVAFTDTLTGTSGAQMAYIPVLPYAGDYSVVVTNSATVEWIRPNYLETFLKRQDWGYVTLPESAGDILYLLALKDHVIVVCRNGLYRLTPLMQHVPTFSLVHIIDMQMEASDIIVQQTAGDFAVLLDDNEEFWLIDNKLAFSYLLYPRFEPDGCRIYCVGNEIVITPPTGASHVLKNGIHVTSTVRKLAPRIYSDDAVTTYKVATLDTNLGVSGMKRLEKIDIVGFGAWHVKIYTRDTSIQGTRKVTTDMDVVVNDSLDHASVGLCFLVEITGHSSAEFALEDVILWWRQCGRTKQDARPDNKWYR